MQIKCLCSLWLNPVCCILAATKYATIISICSLRSPSGIAANSISGSTSSSTGASPCPRFCSEVNRGNFNHIRCRQRVTKPVGSILYGQLLVLRPRNSRDSACVADRRIDVACRIVEFLGKGLEELPNKIKGSRNVRQMNTHQQSTAIAGIVLDDGVGWSLAQSDIA